MIVRITKILLLLQLAVALVFATVAHQLFHVNLVYSLCIGMAAVLLVRLSITANNFFLAWRFRSETPAGHRLNAWQACRLFFGEYRATMTASSWTMPFCTFSRRGDADSGSLPVLLIHGYGCNSGYWHAMSKKLTQARIAHYAIDLEPVTGGIDEYVPGIHDAVERICKESSCTSLIIVAHSMGGLATRAYLREHGRKRIAKAITLGTPHHGTGLARFGIGLNTRQMIWKSLQGENGKASHWLCKLAESEDKDAYRLIVSLYSHQDNIISPQTSSHLQGAQNIEFHGIGHVALAFHPLIQARVIQEIHATFFQHNLHLPELFRPE